MYLDTVLLLSTFMFAFSTSYLAAFAPSDLTAQDDFWYDICQNQTHGSNDRLKFWCGDLKYDLDRQSAYAVWTELPSRQLGLRIIWTYTALGIAVLAGVIAFVGFLFAEPARFKRPVLKSWWRIFQWPVHATLVCFMGGCFLFMYTNSSLVRVIYPDPAVLAGIENRQSVWVSVQTFQWIMVWIIVVALSYQLVGLFLWVNAYKAVYTNKNVHPRLQILADALKFKQKPGVGRTADKSEDRGQIKPIEV